MIGALVAASPIGQSVSGQGPTRLSGRVTDSLTGAGIIGAEVRLAGGAASVLSGERGLFSLLVPGPASIVLEVRRLGYRPTQLAVRSPGKSVDVVLATAEQTLAPIQVRARREKYTGRLAGYFSRLERGTQGVFITREDLEREQPTQLTDMLQRTPGVRVTRGRPGAQSIRLRGRDCRPLVWLDGAAMPTGDVDLDSFSPTSLEGIELYLGASAPAGFQAARGQSECGTVLLWSRSAETEHRLGSMATPAELEELLASLSVFNAEQVDRRAALDSTQGWSVPYPQSLRASGTGGRVVAEFVVDSLGRVELGHFGIVSSTDRLFSEAVRASAPDVRFTPARKGSRAVRQLVRQAFEFRPDSERH
jgi:hypothetical protein